MNFNKKHQRKDERFSAEGALRQRNDGTEDKSGKKCITFRAWTKVVLGDKRVKRHCRSGQMEDSPAEEKGQQIGETEGAAEQPTRERKSNSFVLAFISN
ncbi:hypothetical protein HPP92_005194 [Vanilla planifolia]|uniref:Uncharacterized protein n=1 Tax=Vanilla planifolia TaxID=51239 RepID=A0A835VEN3_VANPL|nr:hypothetical protein HPP92_005493 [Vanilla planifolia]KAG0494200.1 hypothetical protein HPP92_005194 [Vanilla planifolia]